MSRRKNLGTLVAEVKAETSDFVRGISKAEGALKQFSNVRVGRIAKGVGAAAAGMAALGAAAAAGIGAATAHAAKFEDAIAEAASKAGATQKVMNKFEEAAISAGESSTFSAVEAGNALESLAQAGLKTNEAVGALPGTLQLAEAGGVQLARAADIATNVLSGFNKEVSSLGHVNDVLVKTSTSANTAVAELGQAMSFVAPLAQATGNSIEAMSASAGLLANAGIKASRAGTTLRGALARLMKPTGPAQKAIKKLGLNIRDSGGQMLPFIEILGQLEQKGASSAEIIQIFGCRAGPGIQSLLSQGISSLENFRGSLVNAGGTAENQAAFMRKSLGRQFKILTGSVKTLLTTIGQQFAPTIKGMTKVFTGLTNDLRNSEGAMQSLREAAAAIAPAIGGGLELVGDIGDRVSEVMGALSLQWDTATTAGNKFSAELDKISDKLQTVPGHAKQMATQVGKLVTKERKLKEQLDSVNLSLGKRIELENKLQNTELRRKKTMLRNIQQNLKGLEKVLPKMRQIQAQRDQIAEFENKSLGGIVRDVSAERRQQQRKLRRLQQPGAQAMPGEITKTKRAIKALKVLESHQNSLVNEAGELRQEWGSIEEIMNKHTSMAEKAAKLQGDIAQLGGETAEEMAKVDPPDPLDPDPIKEAKNSIKEAKKETKLLGEETKKQMGAVAGLLTQGMTGLASGDQAAFFGALQGRSRGEEKARRARFERARRASARRGQGGGLSRLDKGLIRAGNLGKKREMAAARGAGGRRLRRLKKQKQFQQITNDLLAGEISKQEALRRKELARLNLQKAQRKATVETIDKIGSGIGQVESLAGAIGDAAGASKKVSQGMDAAFGVVGGGAQLAGGVASGNPMAILGGVTKIGKSIAKLFGADKGQQPKRREGFGSPRNQAEMAKRNAEAWRQVMEESKLVEVTVLDSAGRRRTQEMTPQELRQFNQELDREQALNEGSG